jgi:hypothetical protein
MRMQWVMKKGKMISVTSIYPYTYNIWTFTHSMFDIMFVYIHVWYICMHIYVLVNFVVGSQHELCFYRILSHFPPWATSAWMNLWMCGMCDCCRGGGLNPCPISHASSLMPHLSCPISHAPSLMPHLSCPITHTSSLIINVAN